MKKSNEQWLKEVQDLVGNSYIFLEPYKGAHVKIQYYHVDCGHIHNITPTNFLHGQRCPDHKYQLIQQTKHTKYNTQYFKERMYKLVGNEYTLNSEYEKAKIKVNIIHNKCGYRDWWVTPSDFLSGHRCPKCSQKIRTIKETKTQEEFKKEVEVLGKGEYILVGEYKNWKTPVEIKHLKCGKVNPMAPSSFLRGSRCTCTKHSIGEDMISDILSANNINYIQHAKFSWLRYKKPQHLDFYLPDFNVGLEYDGEQHFNKNKNWFSKDIVARDKNKDKLCREHNVKLIRLSYNKYKNKESISKLLINAGIVKNKNNVI